MPDYNNGDRIEALSDESLGLVDRLIRYLGQFDNWFIGDGKGYVEIYEPNPMYVISEITDENEYVDDLEFDFEWSRGEIGASQPEGNYSYVRQIRFINTVIRQIHLVSFDNGKKQIVAPDWEPIGKGRFYHYLSDSLGYAYQRFHFREGKNDHSKSLRMRHSRGKFDIPILKDKDELKRFVNFCGVTDEETHTSDKEEQTELFYALLEQYDGFKVKERQLETSKRNC